jgi:hypothetical protein
MAMRKSMCCVVTENPPVISTKQLKIDEGQVIANDLAVCIFPNLFAKDAVPDGATNCGHFIGNLDELAGLLSR